MDKKVISVEIKRDFDVVDKTWGEEVYVKLYCAARLSGFLRAIPNNLFKVLCTLATYMDSQGNCYPSQEQLANDLGLSRTQVNRLIKKLLDWRWQGQPIVLAHKRRDEGNRFENTVYTVLPITNLVFGPKRQTPETQNPTNTTKDTSMLTKCHMDPSRVNDVESHVTKMSHGKDDLPENHVTFQSNSHVTFPSESHVTFPMLHSLNTNNNHLEQEPIIEQEPNEQDPSLSGRNKRASKESKELTKVSKLPSTQEQIRKLVAMLNETPGIATHHQSYYGLIGRALKRYNSYNVVAKAIEQLRFELNTQSEIRKLQGDIEPELIGHREVAQRIMARCKWLVKPYSAKSSPENNSSAEETPTERNDSRTDSSYSGNLWDYFRWSSDRKRLVPKVENPPIKARVVGNRIEIERVI